MTARIAALAAPYTAVAAVSWFGLSTRSIYTRYSTEISSHPNDWALANKDYANTRSANSTIDSSNVSRLGVAWTFAIPGTGSYGAAATSPLIIDGVVYLEDLQSNVVAIDLQSGAVKWEHDYNDLNYGPDGPAVGYGKLFVNVGHTNVAALDLQTGNEVWNQQVTQKDTEGIDIQPTVYDGLVYVSTVPGNANSNWYTAGVSGILYALDAQTGNVVWQFNTSKDNLWGHPDLNSGGGAWYTPAIDTQSDTVFFDIGNPAPWPGTSQYPNGSSRPGPNLYNDATLAFDAANGTMKWYTQVFPHDLFDHDLQIAPILGTMTAPDGTQHDAVFASGKLGEVWAFDRTTGNVLWNRAVGEHFNSRLPAIPAGKTVKVLPGPLGGVETPMALASDGSLYVPVVNLPGYFTAEKFVSDKFDINSGKGELDAIDVNTGAILWAHSFDQIDFGGATVVNDLVFTSTYDGTVHALDRQTGDQVWSWKAPAGVNGWLSVVGDTIILPAGVGTNPELVALRLGASNGQMVTPEASATSTAQATAAPPSTPTETPQATATQATTAAPTATEQATHPLPAPVVKAVRWLSISPSTKRTKRSI